jgi:hypothetical protein
MTVLTHAVVDITFIFLRAMLPTYLLMPTLVTTSHFRWVLATLNRLTLSLYHAHQAHRSHLIINNISQRRARPFFVLAFLVPVSYCVVLRTPPHWLALHGGVLPDCQSVCPVNPWNNPHTSSLSSWCLTSVQTQTKATKHLSLFLSFSTSLIHTQNFCHTHIFSLIFTHRHFEHRDPGLGEENLHIAATKQINSLVGSHNAAS